MGSSSLHRSTFLRLAASTASVLLALGICGCGGGGGSSLATLPPEQWKSITFPPVAGAVAVFETCASKLIVQGATHLGLISAVVSEDHGITWQDDPALISALQELNSGAYWHAPHIGSAVTALEDTRDCGITWTSLGQQQLLSCLDGISPNGFWRGGAASSLLYAQAYNPATGLTFLCVSSDNGQSWTPRPAPLVAVTAVRDAHWFGIAALPNPVAGGRPIGLLMRSGDQGQTWLSTGLYSSANGLVFVSATAQGPVMYAIATNQAPTTSGSGVEVLWMWDDARGTWTAAPAFPTAIEPSLVRSIAASPMAANEIFLSTFGGGVFESRDSGVTWIDVSNGLPGTPSGWDLLFDPSLRNRLYAWTTASLAESFWALDIAQ